MHDLAQNRPGRLAAALLVVALALLAAGPLAAQDTPAGDSRLEGVIINLYGEPVPGCRVVARDAAGADVFVSSPSDEAGKYALLVPRGREYVVVALVSPTGGRVSMPEARPMPAAGPVVTRDLLVPMAVAPRPRKALKHLGGVDRFFNAFVEDAALVARQYYEISFDGATFDAGSRRSAAGLVAFQFPSMTRMEFGLRGGVAERLLDGAPNPDPGATDAELWAKLHLHRSSDNRFDTVVGAQATLPTGDPDVGTGNDSLQSKLFVGVTYTLQSAVLLGHAGVRVSGDGERLLQPLEGRVSVEGGIGVLIPMTDLTSLVVEADWNDRRFEQTDERGELLFGVNWRPSPRGIARFAAAAGLTETSADVRVLAAYAFAF